MEDQNYSSEVRALLNALQGGNLYNDTPSLQPGPPSVPNGPGQPMFMQSPHAGGGQYPTQPPSPVYTQAMMNMANQTAPMMQNPLQASQQMYGNPPMIDPTKSAGNATPGDSVDISEIMTNAMNNFGQDNLSQFMGNMAMQGYNFPTIMNMLQSVNTLLTKGHQTRNTKKPTAKIIGPR